MKERQPAHGRRVEGRLDADGPGPDVAHDLPEAPELLAAAERGVVRPEPEVLSARPRAAQTVDRPIGHAADRQIVEQVVDRQVHELGLRRVHAVLVGEPTDCRHPPLVPSAVPVVAEYVDVLPHVRVGGRGPDVVPRHPRVDAVGELPHSGQPQPLHPLPEDLGELGHHSWLEGVVVACLVADGVVVRLDLVSAPQVLDEGRGVLGVLTGTVQQERRYASRAAAVEERRAQPELKRIAVRLNPPLEGEDIGFDVSVRVFRIEPGQIGVVRVAVVVLQFPARHGRPVAVRLLPAEPGDSQAVDRLVDDLLPLLPAAVQVERIAAPASDRLVLYLGPEGHGGSPVRPDAPGSAPSRGENEYRCCHH